jgi:hypothetical protein
VGLGFLHQYGNAGTERTLLACGFAVASHSSCCSMRSKVHTPFDLFGLDNALNDLNHLNGLN